MKVTRLYTIYLCLNPSERLGLFAWSLCQLQYQLQICWIVRNESLSTYRLPNFVQRLIDWSLNHE
ncbi:hypothetical protein PROFUN_05959 [Planoprotostelium fungivorum]|uniref:Uncharacterized protein n=1 Tax=Planoprotostelium fungivorum TaxID=1890364 RepID=A0A2P6N7Q3_9EUKA|nr:hypothetical protein PROFUN_05959 [Planoprotostelium fungivorum]